MSDLASALRSCYSALDAAHETMQQILAGTLVLRKEEWEVIEPIHADALQRAGEALDEFDHTKFDAESPLKIKRWISFGELDDAADTQELYVNAGGLLDASNASEIFGTVLFEGENGKYYTMTVEGVLGEASDEFVRDVLGDSEEGTDGEEESTG